MSYDARAANSAIPVTTMAEADADDGDDFTTPDGAVLTSSFFLEMAERRRRTSRAYLMAPYVLEVRMFDTIANNAFEWASDVRMMTIFASQMTVLPCGAPFVQTQPVRLPGKARTTGSERVEKAVAAGEVDRLRSTTDKPDAASRAALGLRTSSIAIASDDRAAGDDLPPCTVLFNRLGQEAMCAMGPCHWHLAATPPPAGAVLWPCVSPAALALATREAHAYPPVWEVPVARQDMFSTLYPTLEVLTLMENPFVQMPDLYRCRRLRSLSICRSAFTEIDSGCPAWRAARRAYEASLSAERAAEQDHEDDTTRRGRALEAMRTYAAAAATSFCPHARIPVHDFSTMYDVTPPMPFPLPLQQTCSTLRFLDLEGNGIRTFRDFVGLLCYKSVTVLDLSHNQIDDGEALLIVLAHMPQLVLLTLKGNPCVQTLPHYRRRVLLTCPNLNALDAEPVFEQERSALASSPAATPPPPPATDVPSMDTFSGGEAMSVPMWSGVLTPPGEVRLRDELSQESSQKTRTAIPSTTTTPTTTVTGSATTLQAHEAYASYDTRSTRHILESVSQFVYAPSPPPLRVASQPEPQPAFSTDEDEEDEGNVFIP